MARNTIEAEMARRKWLTVRGSGVRQAEDHRHSRPSLHHQLRRRHGTWR